MADHTWRPVTGYEGYYEVSDHGDVRRAGRSEVLKGGRLKGGYRCVNLSVNGSAHSRRVHALVMSAFVGPRPEGMVVCHNNGIPHDNRLSNLRYDTTAANAMDSVRHGTCYQASKTRCPSGHMYDEENTRYVNTPSGSYTGRQCRACDRARARRARSVDRDAYNRCARERRAKKKLVEC